MNTIPGWNRRSNGFLMHPARHTAGMKGISKASVGVVMVLALLGAALIPHAFATANPAAQLQSQVQVAESGQAYASGLFAQAVADHLDVTSSEALIASGNSSLAQAQLALTSGTNVTAGIQEAGAAIKDFAAASVSLGAALQSAGLTASVGVASQEGAIASLNSTAAAMSAVLVNACTTTAVNSSQAAAFESDCAAGKSDVAGASAALAKASTAGSVSASEAFTAQAQGNLSAATTIITQLAGYGYAARANAFIEGPMASLTAAANSTSTTQDRLSSEYASLVSSFQTTATAVDTGSANAVLGVSTVSSAVASLSFLSMDGAISAQESTLASISSSLSLLDQQIPATLPSTVIATIQADISASQNALATYDSEMQSSVSDAASFSQVTVAGVQGNVSLIANQADQTESDGAAFSTSLSVLQQEVSAVAAQFPLLTILGTWSATLSSEQQSASSGSASVDASLNSVTTEMATLSSDVSIMTSTLDAAAQLQVTAALIQNATTLSSSETALLNTSASAALAQAASSLQTTAGQVSAFSTASQAVLKMEMGQMASASESLSSEGTSLKAQVTASATLLAYASAVVQSDAQWRAGALSTGTADVQQAVSLFDEQNVSAGAGLLVQASAEFQLAAQQA